MYRMKPLKASYNIMVNVILVDLRRGKWFGLGRKTMLRFGHTVRDCQMWDSHAENLIRTRTELILGVR